MYLYEQYAINIQRAPYTPVRRQLAQFFFFVFFFLRLSVIDFPVEFFQFSKREFITPRICAAIMTARWHTYIPALVYIYYIYTYYTTRITILPLYRLPRTRLRSGDTFDLFAAKGY